MRRARLAAALLALLAAMPSTSVAGPAAAGGQAVLDAAQRRGRSLYTTGAAASGGEVVALLGDGDVEVAGSVLPCLNCHGDDGRGNPEGGVVPADVSWAALTRPSPATAPADRRRPAYDRALLARAITEGLDAGGTPLDATMPRYRMAPSDLADLIAWLEVIGTIADPGITDTTLTFGVLLPPAGTLDAMAASIRGALGGYFAEINRRGGLYGRDVALEFLVLPDAADETAAAVRELVAREHPLALVAAFIAGVDDEVTLVANELRLPVIGAVALYPRPAFPDNRYVFYLYAGIPQQGRALASFAVAEHGDAMTAAAIVHPGEPGAEAFAVAVRDQLAADGITQVIERRVDDGAIRADDLARELRDAGVGAVFLLGSGTAAVELLAAAERLSWTPLLLMPGSSAGTEIFAAPPAADGRVFLSYPTLPADRTEAALLEYRSLVEAYGLDARYPSLQLSALAAAELLVEALAVAGRDVSRQRLVRALEDIHELETGLMAPISYGPDRRIGADGAWVVAVDVVDSSLGAYRWVPFR